MAKFMLPYPDKLLTGHFGKIRTINGKKTQPHRGTDWGVKRGTPIPAISDGTVMLVDFSKILGWVLVQSVKGNDGKVMYVGYCHMDTEPTLKVKDKLKMGQEIGKIGNTGMSSGPHLHATLSPTVKGVFSGVVVDLYKYIQEQLKSPSTGFTAPKKTETNTQEAPAKAAAAKCPHCGKEIK